MRTGCWATGTLSRGPGAPVINRCISLLRKVATDAGGFAIETVPKAGYRLMEEDGIAPPGRVRWPFLAGAGLAAATIAAGIMVVGRPGEPAGGSPPIQVLPFIAEGGQSPAPEVAAAAQQALARTLADQGFTVQTPPTTDHSRQDLVIKGNVIRAGNAVQATVVVEQGKQPLSL